ncbi:MAG: hypothetical protein NTV43_00200 [Methylococcales bacterium]|nr:hypothetical protein [Methylococcales bacterium]
MPKPKLIATLLLICLTACTAHDRFALKLNAELDACAMKRMAGSKFNSQQGYLQAHYECHQIVIIQKGYAMHLKKAGIADRDKKDVFETYPSCWQFVKGMVLDQYYPDLRLIEPHNGHNLTEQEAHENKVALEIRKFALPDKLADLSKQKLIMVRDMLNTTSVIGHHDTLCSVPDYHALIALIGREVHRRYPNGVDENYARGFQ